MKNVLTEKQQEILDFIRLWNIEKQMPPTLQQMADHFGVKCSTVAYHIEALRKKGVLERTSESRSIVLKDQSFPCQRKNCLRKIGIRKHANDIPDMALGSVLIPDEILELCGPEQVIAFQMPDDSLFELGIHVDDILLFIPVSLRQPEAGDIVLAASPDGRDLVRSYYPHSVRRFELVSSNDAFKTEIFSSADNVLRGVMATLIRNY